MLKIKPFLSSILLGLASIACLSSCDCQSSDAAAEAQNAEIHELADLAGKRTGFLTGSMFQEVLGPLQPGIVEFRPYDYTQQLIQALRKGKIDAVLEDEPIAYLWSAYYPEELYVAFTYADDSYSFATRKGDTLNSCISAVIQQLEQSGELEQFKEKWCKSIDPNRHITKWEHKKDYDGSAGTIRYATDPTQMPMVYQTYNELLGLDIEVINRVAYELNMKVEYSFMNFATLLDAHKQNKADLVGGCMSITPERQKTVDFVHPYYKGGMAVLARYAKKKDKEKAE